MSTATPVQPHRDNLLGICNAIGQAFGFDPLYLRILFIVGLLADFQAAAIAYLLCGVAVLAAAGADRLASRSSASTAAA